MSEWLPVDLGRLLCQKSEELRQRKVSHHVNLGEEAPVRQAKSLHKQWQQRLQDSSEQTPD
jgi:hypothetical protein